MSQWLHLATRVLRWLKNSLSQMSAFGPFAGPPVVAWVTSRAGGWHWTWAAAGVAAALGLLPSDRIGRARLAIARPRLLNRTLLAFLKERDRAERIAARVEELERQKEATRLARARRLPRS